MKQYVTRYDFQNAKTEEKIKEVFFSLSRSGKNVTVSSICRGAGINRSTFYRHFEDVYDLIYECKEEFLIEMHSLFFVFTRQESFTKKGVLKKSVIKRLLHACLNRKNEILTLMTTSLDSDFRNDFTFAITEIIEGVYDRYEWKNHKYKSYSAVRLASGMVTMIIKWLDEEDMSMDEFCKLFTAISFNSIELTGMIRELP